MTVITGFLLVILGFALGALTASFVVRKFLQNFPK